jgi:hypothetical protein
MQSYIPSFTAALGEGTLVPQGGLPTRQGQFHAVCQAASAGLSRAPLYLASGSLGISQLGRQGTRYIPRGGRVHPEPRHSLTGGVQWFSIHFSRKSRTALSSRIAHSLGCPTASTAQEALGRERRLSLGNLLMMRKLQRERREQEAGRAA